ncbi:hypothetical protein PTI98_009660 [Pleurotus ostreatus]|nr:hypothetical protein PTI98_009660 [Pleurotus ostreatus]
MQAAGVPTLPDGFIPRATIFPVVILGDMMGRTGNFQPQSNTSISVLEPACVSMILRSSHCIPPPMKHMVDKLLVSPKHILDEQLSRPKVWNSIATRPRLPVFPKRVSMVLVRL